MISNSFESLRIWHDARQLVVRIYSCTKRGMFDHDHSLCDQIRRAAVSVMSNIAEGHERGGKREFLRFLSIAKGSCGEVRSQLYAAEDLHYIETQLAAELRGEAALLSRRITALAKSRMKAMSG